MLLKAHLISYSRMFGFRWVTTPSWLPRSLRPFLCSFVLSRHLFLISSASIRSLLVLSFIVPIFAWNVPLISPVLLKRYRLSHSIIFPLFLCIVHLRPSYLSLLFSGILHSVGCYLSPLPFTSLLSSAFFFFFLEMVLATASCTMLQTFIQSSSGTLPDLIPWIYSSPPLYNHKGFDLVHISVVFI